ncbi:hypothetical protein EVAR_94159_1 [Eumeta japonica]|uniref:Uncharacterized protein n=1 Tax=Eumeta variegata TaxID=151549 RepID=A0A4C1U723_EUMVA|nr:hypothetical protein EVAR_94159_1 [Eumeta japonica]
MRLVGCLLLPTDIRACLYEPGMGEGGVEPRAGPRQAHHGQPAGPLVVESRSHGIVHRHSLVRQHYDPPARGPRSTLVQHIHVLHTGRDGSPRGIYPFLRGRDYRTTGRRATYGTRDRLSKTAATSPSYGRGRATETRHAPPERGSVRTPFWPAPSANRQRWRYARRRLRELSAAAAGLKGCVVTRPVIGGYCCARGRPIIVEWERDARHSAGLSLVRFVIVVDVSGRAPIAVTAYVSRAGGGGPVIINSATPTPRSRRQTCPRPTRRSAAPPPRGTSLAGQRF